MRPVCAFFKAVHVHVPLWSGALTHIPSEGGCFKAHLIFPKEYPQRPPTMKFISEMWHPNGEIIITCVNPTYSTNALHTCLHNTPSTLWLSPVDKEGKVCISILHEPGEDKWGYEKPEERWLPIHTVETILISVISMLADPNDESPANVDAAVSLV